MIQVEQWAEIRRMRFVEQRSIRDISRRTGLHRDTIRRALASGEPPTYRRSSAGPSKLDRFREEIARLLDNDPKIPGKRVREQITELGYQGSKTILDDYLREIRPLYLRPRTYQRTSYRPAEICQFDLWEPSKPVPVGCGQTRRGYVVVGCLGWSRAGAGALVFSKRAEDLLWGMSRCLERLGGLPDTLVWDREGALHAGEGRPTAPFASFCGALGVGWRILEPADPESKGVVERLQQYAETNFEPGRSFAGELDFQAQLDSWFDERANARFHRVIRAVPTERLQAERERMRALPELMPDTEQRKVLRVPPQPYLRWDTNDYSLDPRLAGRRVEVRVSQRTITAVALDTGELACRHRRLFARHRTITAPAHQLALEGLRGGRRTKPDVEIRALARYDALIPA